VRGVFDIGLWIHIVDPSASSRHLPMKLLVAALVLARACIFFLYLLLVFLKKKKSIGDAQNL